MEGAGPPSRRNEVTAALETSVDVLDRFVDLDSTSPPTLVDSELRASASSLLDVTAGETENLCRSLDDISSSSSSPSESLKQQRQQQMQQPQQQQQPQPDAASDE